jgi:hypothetical protein
MSSSSNFRDSVAGQGDDTLARIAYQLDKGMCRSEEPGKAFICEHVVQSIWSNGNDIRGLLNSRRWDDDEIGLIQKDFIKVLSILILVGFDTQLSTYCETYLNEKEFTDHKLPFDREKLLHFLDERKASRFWEHQYKFLPVLIENDSLNIEPQFRLPFVSERSGIARGSYGVVDEVSVAPGYLMRDGSSNWPNVSSPPLTCLLYFC